MGDNKSSSQFPLPGIALVFLVLGVFIFSDNPFNPTRPDAPPNLTSTAEDVRARLWQDPFEAVEVHRSRKHSGIKKKQLRQVETDLSEYYKYQDQQHRVCNFKSKKILDEYRKDINEIRDNPEYGKTAILKRNNKEVRKPKRTSAHTIDELRCQIQRDVKYQEQMEKDVQILAVMVTGGPYAEDREVRIRTRYAVISGLSSAGYAPKDPEHIGYMDFTGQCEKAFNGSTSNSKFCDWPATIPYEWFDIQEEDRGRSELKSERFSNSVLVLWLDDQEIALEKPLEMLDRLRHALTPGPHERFVKKKPYSENQYKEDVRVKFDILGPASSTTLIKMYKEADEECAQQEESEKCNMKIKDDGDNVRILSPRATINEARINEILKKPGEKEPVAWFGVDVKNNQSNKKHTSWFNLKRMISTDEMLVENLLCELLRRGVNPYLYGAESSEVEEKCNNFSRSALNKKGKQDHIVLIGEWDTVYSRNFIHLFEKNINKYSNERKVTRRPIWLKAYYYIEGLLGGEVDQQDVIEKQRGNEPVGWLHSYNYFRGIDGSLGQNAAGTGNTYKKNDKGNDGDEKKTFRRPVGSNQFDYLRRLGDQLTKLSNKITGNNDGAIRAIGVVGSDTYDKLLVLQALRARFPDALFFTTDLDARMLHIDENKWARNLIVASGYGLTPDDEIVHELLPFRDGYQTAIYLAALSATQCKMVADRCVAITDVSENDSCAGKNNSKVFEIGNREAIDYSQNGVCGNNENIVSGGSSNNSTLYFVLSIFLLILLIYQTSNDTRFYVIVSAVISYTVLGWVVLLDPFNSIEFNVLMSGTSIWPALIIRMFAAVLALFFILFSLVGLRVNINRIIDRHKLDFMHSDGFTFMLCERFKKLSLTDNKFSEIIYAFYDVLRRSVKDTFKFRHFDENKIRDLDYKNISLWAHMFITVWGWRHDAGKKININELMYQYMEMGRTRWWFSRVMLMLLLYFFVTMTFISSYPSFPLAPFRGEVSAFSHISVLSTVLILYLFLVFLVVDITRLNARFVELLSRCTIEWPRSVSVKYCEKYGVSEVVAMERLKLDLIVQRSKAVDLLIFLPFIVLSLMIFSRSSYFDRWYLPLHIGIVIVLGALIALSSAIRLRRSAKKARSVALEHLVKEFKSQLYRESKQEAVGHRDRLLKWRSHQGLCEYKMSERIQGIIDEVDQIKEGPFKPISQHPIVSAVAMPFGGVGGLYLIDYFSTMGI